MTLAEYAAYHRSVGERIIESGGVFWRRVRPFFYRPVAPWQALDPATARPPDVGLLGGCQFVVKDGQSANSSIAFLVFPEAARYSLNSLDKKRRWEVRAAMTHFEVRMLRSPDELAGAHGVYLDFQRRTRYRYRADRVRPDRFVEWARTVFRHPKTVVLGAFAGGRMDAVAICHPVEDTLVYATFFARDAALRLHVSSLMLDRIRTLAAETGAIRQVFGGLRKTGRAMHVDDFYLQRGCQVAVRPAQCRLPPLTEIVLCLLLPRRHGQIMGAAWEKGEGQQAPTRAGGCAATSESVES